jgi:hypothetical protein
MLGVLQLNALALSQKIGAAAAAVCIGWLIMMWCQLLVNGYPLLSASIFCCCCCCCCCCRDVVGSIKGFRPDKIPLTEIISRVGGQQKFDAAVLETILIKAMSDVSAFLEPLEHE